MTSQKISLKGHFYDENGERGIRTLEQVAPLQHFQCCAFNHSAISPSIDLNVLP